MRRALIAIFSLALGLSAVPARAQYDADLERQPIGNPNPEGRPRTFRPSSPLSYYLWHDGSGWHLRSTTSGHYHTFSGQVQAPEGVYNVHTTDPGTQLQISGNAINFNYGVQGGERGFDWAGGGPMNFNLTIDGRDRSEKIRIGYSEERPSPGGIQLYPGGAGPAPAAMAQPMPAADESYSDVQSAEGPEMDPDAFQPVLSPYGSWVTADGYGTVWQPYPNVVGAGFSPYGYGHWAYTDLGWTWVSGYDWGWAPFHYGNWVYVNGGWGWMPGRTWAPAWVTWRYGGGYVGWAPCAPYGHEVVVEPARYSFVTVGGFNRSENIHGTIITGEQAVVIHGRTEPCPSATYVNGRGVVPVGVGPSPHLVAKESGHPVTPVAARSLERVGPPPNTRGAHNTGFAAHPMQPETARAFVKSQPAQAQHSFEQGRQERRIAEPQVGKAMQPAEAAHVVQQARSAPAPAMAARPAAGEAYHPPAYGSRAPAPEPATEPRSETEGARAPAAHEAAGEPEHEGARAPEGGQPAKKPPPPPPPPKRQPEKRH